MQQAVQDGSIKCCISGKYIVIICTYCDIKVYVGIYVFIQWKWDLCAVDKVIIDVSATTVLRRVPFPHCLQSCVGNQRLSFAVDSDKVSLMQHMGVTV